MNKMNNTKNYAKKVAKDFNILTRLYQIYATYLLFMPFSSLFYNIKCHGREHLPKGNTFIYAANHVSYFDPFLVTFIARRKMGFMAKKELFESSNYLAKNICRLGSFSVNREKPEVSTLKSSKEAFKAGWGLCIFPQGGIRKNKKIEEINKGFVAVAKMVKADIVPIAITGLESYNWNIFKKVRVDVKIGPVISHKMTDEEIIQSWRERVAEMSCYELCEISTASMEPVYAT